jgi:hypothetical protein
MTDRTRAIEGLTLGAALTAVFVCTNSVSGAAR